VNHSNSAGARRRRLTLSDQRKALAFVRDAYLLRGFTEFIAFVLDALPKLIDSEVTSYNEMRPQRAESRNWVSPAALMVPERHEAWTRVMHQHPVVAHYQKVGASEVLRISDFLSTRQLRNMALYSEHYAPLGGMLDCLPILWSRGHEINAIGVHRHRQFTERELATMNFVRGHLIQIHGNSVAVSRIENHYRAFERALEANNVAIVILKPDRKIAFAMDLARRWLAEYFGRAPAAEKLPEVLDVWLRQQDLALQQLLDLPAPRKPLLIVRERRRLLARLLSSESQTVIILEEQDLEIAPDALASLGLTRRESEVLAALASGRAKSEIAERLGVSRRTLESHVLHINDKLEVPSTTASLAKAFAASRIGSLTASHAELNEAARRIRGGA
jgi:DNA-binding CsgD family transcriptional regulator